MVGSGIESSRASSSQLIRAVQVWSLLAHDAINLKVVLVLFFFFPSYKMI